MWDLLLFLLLGRLGSGEGGGLLRGFCPFQWTVCFGEVLPEKIQDAQLIGLSDQQIQYKSVLCSFKHVLKITQDILILKQYSLI